MLARFRAGFSHPARRRLWLTIASGILIALGLLARYGFGEIGVWSAAMVAAALLAGADIAVRAVQALRIRHLSIELLVTVAAVGALAIGEYWEAAAVTFLFIFGSWLEARTMLQTRGALKALIDAAPATATVLRDGQPVEIAASAVEVGETVLVKAGQRAGHGGRHPKTPASRIMLFHDLRRGRSTNAVAAAVFTGRNRVRGSIYQSRKSSAI